jgi:hypothetical protein
MLRGLPSAFGAYGLSTVAIVVALTGTASAVTYVVASNSQIGPGTVAGHHPPTGKHANIITGSINGTDLADPARVTVAAATTGSTDPCGSLRTDIYCGTNSTSHWAGRPSGASTDWEPVTVTKDLEGFVHLQGMAHCVTSSNATACPTIFILPVALRPKSGLTFPVDCASSSARIDVSPLGVVRWEPGSGCDPTNYLSLSGVIFHAS